MGIMFLTEQLYSFHVYVEIYCVGVKLGVPTLMIIKFKRKNKDNDWEMG